MKKEDQTQKMIWTPVCMSIGIGAGMLIGSACGQLPAGLSIGIGFGLAIGGVVDHISRKSKG